MKRVNSEDKTIDHESKEYKEKPGKRKSKDLALPSLGYIIFSQTILGS